MVETIGQSSSVDISSLVQSRKIARAGSDIEEKMETRVTERQSRSMEAGMYCEMQEYMEVDANPDTEPGFALSTESVTTSKAVSMSAMKSESCSSLISREKLQFANTESGYIISKSSSSQQQQESSLNTITNQVMSSHGSYAANQTIASEDTFAEIDGRVVTSSVDPLSEKWKVAGSVAAPVPPPKSPKVIPPPALPDLPPALDYRSEQQRGIAGVRSVLPSSVSRKRPIPTVSFGRCMCHCIFQPCTQTDIFPPRGPVSK